MRRGNRRRTLGFGTIAQPGEAFAQGASGMHRDPLGTPRRILERAAGHLDQARWTRGRLVQIGIRTMNPHQREQAQRFGVDVIEMRDWRPGYDLGLEGPLYVSIDLDVLDPAFAPGVSHHEPGGMSVREVIDVIQRLDARPVGGDIVELHPERDSHDRTAAVACKLLKELAAAML